ncbi:YoaK family protein [Streptomyces sp. NBC_01497]|uniref:YoaK family protein n=1 Tax=Streptomyces sp. NBC_01497 TaxID=2903885 RepID=UPI002E2F94AB|nr:YoaK family protein [Streptomyces sp. NBC_01497]
MKREPRQKRHTSHSLRLGALLTLTGGFLDGFTYVGHGGVFANAQSGNIVLLGVFGAERHWRAAIAHVPPLVAFVLGILVAESLMHPRRGRAVRRPDRVAIIAEIAVLLVVGALPQATVSLVVVLLVAFAAAVQNSTFDTLRDWTFNSTMATGNVRTATRAAYRSRILREHGAGRQARSFTTICLAFLCGAASGGLVTSWWGNHAAWVAAGLLSLGLLLFVVDEAGERGTRHRP